MKNSAQPRLEKKASLKVEKMETPASDYNSDDSILIRQAKVIEKGQLVTRKQFRNKQGHQEAGSANNGTREPLEPSIVTLVSYLIEELLFKSGISIPHFDYDTNKKLSKWGFLSPLLVKSIAIVLRNSLV